MDFDFEQILSASPNPYVLLDTDLVIVWMNDAYLSVTMRRRERLLGRKLFDAFPSEGTSHEQLMASFETVLDSGEPDEIALIRYDIEAPDGTSETRYWSATHTPIFKEGSLRYILQHTVDVTELENLRRARDEMGVIQRARSVQDQNLSLRSETRRLLDLFNQAPGFTAVLVGPEHRFGMANEAYCELVGRDDLLGRPVSEAIPEISEQGFMDTLDRVYETGRPYFGRREKVALNSKNQSEPRARFLNFIFQPVMEDDGTVGGIIVQGYDVTEEVLSLERQELLVNELNHRVKNTLSIVQGLAMQSFKRDDVDQALAVFNARLKSLAAAHNLLTESFWGEAEVHDVLTKAAEAAAGDAMERITLEGESTRLPPQMAVTLAMIVHELCTNALKYGALSNEEGSVTASWHERSGDPSQFVFEWKETGGPPVTEPEKHGFGTRLISRGIGDSATSGATMKFEPDGLRFEMHTGVEST